MTNRLNELRQMLRNESLLSREQRELLAELDTLELPTFETGLPGKYCACCGRALSLKAAPAALVTPRESGSGSTPAANI